MAATKQDEWFSTPQSKRVRKKVQFTLSDEARERLERLAKHRGKTQSALVEALIMAAKLTLVLLAGSCTPRKVTAAELDAEAQADAAQVKYAADVADAEAKHAVAVDAWSVKTRKACKLPPDALIFPASKRAILEQCNAKLDRGLPDAKFPPLPSDQDTKGLGTLDGCRYFVDSYVDTQGVRAKFRCKYDPTMLGTAEWEMLK